jgi:hypothetical protein
MKTNESGQLTFSTHRGETRTFLPGNQFRVSAMM